MASLAPGPRPYPIVGSPQLAVSSHIAGTWETLHQEFGDTFTVRFGPEWSPRRVTVTRTPEGMGTVLGATSPFTKQGHMFFEAFRDILGTGLFSAYGEDWRWQRRTLTPLFTAKASADYATLIRKKAELFTQRWIDHDGPLSLRSEVLRLTLEVVTEMLFGQGREDLADRLEGDFERVSRYVVTRAFGPLVPPRGMPLPSVRRNEAAAQGVRDLAREVLTNTAPVEDSFLARLREAEDEDGRRFTDDEIADQVLVFIAAGHDTTATALTMALQLLGLHPDAQDEAAAEVARLGTPETRDDAQRLTYTTAVIDEAMRLYPSAPGTGRIAPEDTELDGYLVPKGSNVYTNFWSLHRHPDLWTDPLAFVPQRFVDIPARDRPRHTYLPFGAGPRACIGAHTAVLEMQLILSTFLANARVTATTREMPVKSAITLMPATDLPALISPR